MIGPIDGDKLLKWIEECDLVIHFKPELYEKLKYTKEFSLSEVQRALNGKSDEKWERLLAVAMELLKDAAPCDLETVNLDEQAWWNKLNHLKAELEQEGTK